MIPLLFFTETYRNCLISPRISVYFNKSRMITLRRELLKQGIEALIDAIDQIVYRFEVRNK